MADTETREALTLVDELVIEAATFGTSERLSDLLFRAATALRAERGATTREPDGWVSEDEAARLRRQPLLTAAKHVTTITFSNRPGEHHCVPILIGEAPQGATGTAQTATMPENLRFDPSLSLRDALAQSEARVEWLKTLVAEESPQPAEPRTEVEP